MLHGWARDGFGVAEQAGSRKTNPALAPEFGAGSLRVCTQERVSLLIAAPLPSTTKVRTQRIEVILLEGLNCFFPTGRGREGGEIHSFISNDSGAAIYPGRASCKPE